MNIKINWRGLKSYIDNFNYEEEINKINNLKKKNENKNIDLIYKSEKNKKEMNENKIENIKEYLEQESDKEYKIYHLESKKDNILNGLKLYEEIDEEKFNLLLESSLLDIEKKKEGEVWIYKTNKLQLEKYIKNNDKETKKILVIYEKVGKMTYGRCNPKKSLGLFSIARKIRHTLTSEIYNDIDIKNCHPTLLYQISLRSNLNLNYLKDYVENRESKIEYYIKYFKLEDKEKDYKKNKQKIKDLFIIFLYFGSYQEWAKMYDIKEEMDEFLKGYKRDIKKIGDKIYEYNDEIRKEVQENKEDKFILKYNKIGSVVSFYLQEIESQILEKIYKYCNDKKYIKENKAVLCADGLMIKKENFNENIYNEFSELIKREYGFDLIFEGKELNEGYTKDQLIENKIDNVEFFKNFFINESEYNIAEFYYNEIEKDKYIYSNNSGWYEYDENNILKNYGFKIPISLLNNISGSITTYLKNKFFNIDINHKDYKEVFKMYITLCKKIGKSKYVQGVIQYLMEKYNNDKIEELLDNDMNIIAFNNLVYDFSERRFREISKKDYISKTTKYSIDTEIDENYQKKIYDLIYSIFEDEEMIKYWSLINASPLYTNKLESIYLQIGVGGNGKGLLSSILEKVYGNYFYMCPNTFLTSIKIDTDPALIACKGKRYILVSEPKNGSKECKFNKDFIARITGKDTINGRELYKNNVEFRPTFTTFVQCNEAPSIDNIDDSVRRRFKFIHYPFSFVDKKDIKNEYHREVNRDLKDMTNNDSKFINQFMLYLIKTIENNFDENGKYKDLIVPKKCIEKRDEYFEDNNPTKYFIDRYLIKTNNKKDKIKLREIRDLFIEKGLDRIHIKDLATLKNKLVSNEIDEKDIYKSGEMCLFKYKLNDNILKEEEEEFYKDNNKDLFDDNNNSKKINMLDM